VSASAAASLSMGALKRGSFIITEPLSPRLGHIYLPRRAVGPVAARVSGTCSFGSTCSIPTARIKHDMRAISMTRPGC
jgi:hypothetical protein